MRWRVLFFNLNNLEMKEVYEKYKEKDIHYPGYSGKICGFCDDKLIAAIEKVKKDDDSDRTFRKHGKDHFILEQYKDQKYRYFYVNEFDLDHAKTL